MIGGKSDFSSQCRIIMDLYQEEQEERARQKEKVIIFLFEFISPFNSSTKV